MSDDEKTPGERVYLEALTGDDEKQTETPFDYQMRVQQFRAALWAEEVRKAITVAPRIWPRTPPKPLTRKQKLQRLWWRLLDKWPLQWKDRTEW